ncbi:Holliday junction resolvase RusA-like endonuclease [Parabacteroides sp. PFB2-12]|uniref:RusA family crossover junction endodeoxyribonuclease n=1 Tax=unclassified Parabacteroides TaxID=2649774 RepID=UPI0024764675|nr:MULTISPECIES: RusA family crossover junction endodeoxyribonuclease [unclassified Parabacteroides]MDH6343160.1 Holliday junction resolvase RusA-like endonuclease [Parabacteroides sp. PM6-13]MDH6390804.1 Holliday junction resolvase RusA-like endonuclease [Parabacteroides sp. PFB2-12]
MKENNTEIILGQCIGKSNNYLAVPGQSGERRIIKNDKIRAYEKSFINQCQIYKGRGISGRFKLSVTVWHSSVRFDLDNSLKTVLDCLQSVGAITNDSQCFAIQAEKRIDKNNPRIEYSIEEINKQLSI